MRGSRSPNWNGGCENRNKGKWVEKIVRIRSLGGGSQLDMGTEGGI